MGNFLENFSYGAIAAIATPIIIFAGIYAAWDDARRRADLKEKLVHTRSMSIGVLHGGKLALQRMINYHQARADPTILSDTVQKELNLLLKHQYPDLWKLRSAVAKVEMSGEEVEAVRMLDNAWKEQKPHEAYEIEMLLVEMLIYKGDFRKASQCECLKHEQISDARRPLYKAILHVLLENQENQASECWNDFVAIREYFLWQPSMQEDKLDDDVVSDFKEFMKLVELLKKDIRVAVKAKEKLK